MRPRKFVDGSSKHQSKTKIEINGPRPTPLKLKQQETRTIRKPIIIYIRSPEVFHTKPHDFMALVQKLTGDHSGSKDQQKKKTLNQDGYDHLNYNGSGSGVTIHETKKKNPYVGDHIPLFTPSDYFISPQSFLKLSSPNMSTLLSPASLVEFMKELPEY
ncbi:hypothetical protein SSX86_017605 [Deinandra increscens subsp. villosa]|uniref:VQ domain-containing protein n=1 Tax=Deinandra increscens subsp. villosa TaxID=3103831 RepID=A0AAP0GUF5_9ASTR